MATMAGVVLLDLPGTLGLDSGPASALSPLADTGAAMVTLTLLVAVALAVAGVGITLVTGQRRGDVRPRARRGNRS